MFYLFSLLQVPTYSQNFSHLVAVTVQKLKILEGLFEENPQRGTQDFKRYLVFFF